MSQQAVMLITGTRKGIGKHLVEYYLQRDWTIYGCSREPADFTYDNYYHFCLNVSDEDKVKAMFAEISRREGRLDVLINNAGVALRHGPIVGKGDGNI